MFLNNPAGETEAKPRTGCLGAGKGRENTLEHFRCKTGAVVQNGIYFADQTTSNAVGIFVYDLETRRIREVSKTEKPLSVTDSGFALSPDRKFILYTQIDQSGSDIFLLDH